MAISETSLKDVALMTIDEINASGGVLGKQIEPVVVDPASNWPLFAEKARQLITQDKVAVVFGCWTSVSRKSVLPVFEELNGLLFYPVQYEGEEMSQERVLHRRGAEPAGHPGDRIPDEQGRRRRQALLPARHRLRLSAHDQQDPARRSSTPRASQDDDIEEVYTPFGHSDYQTIVANIKKFAQGGKTAVISTINGDSNVPFYKELGNQGLKATDVPVVAFSVGEEELRGIDTKPLVGHLAAWNYFMSLKNPDNDEFNEEWFAYVKENNLPGGDKRVTNDPMEATYVGIHMWKQAVEKAKSTDVDKVRGRWSARRSRRRPASRSRWTRNHHLHKPVLIGEIRADGQFNVVWKTQGPIRAQPWSPFIPEDNARRRADKKSHLTGVRRPTRQPCMCGRRRRGAQATARRLRSPPPARVRPVASSSR